MEHRYGSRYPVDLKVYVRTRGCAVSAQGRLCDISVSGAFVQTPLPPAALLYVSIQFISEDRRLRDGAFVDAYIVRTTETGLGIEWEEIAPPQVIAQILSIPTHREPSPAAEPRALQAART
jgi:hypothetical protein